jgi:hypothetical protein
LSNKSCKCSIKPISLFRRCRPKWLGVGAEREERLDVFDGCSLRQLGEEEAEIGVIAIH